MSLIADNSTFNSAKLTARKRLSHSGIDVNPNRLAVRDEYSPVLTVHAAIQEVRPALMKNWRYNIRKFEPIIPNLCFLV